MAFLFEFVLNFTDISFGFEKISFASSSSKVFGPFRRRTSNSR